MRTYEFTKKIGLTEEDISDILCACIEGGSNYWAQIQNCGEQWDEVEKKLPDGHTIEDHIMAMWDEGYDLVILDVEDDTLHCIPFERFLDAIQSVIDDGTWESDDVCDVDGIVGDCIMQYATFGEVIYG
jgi:hypothetical protein